MKKIKTIIFLMLIAVSVNAQFVGTNGQPKVLKSSKQPLISEVEVVVPSVTPVAWYPLNGNVLDSVSSNDGTLNQAGLTTPVYTTDMNSNANKALAFDSSYVDLNNSTSGSDLYFTPDVDAFSISLWVKTSVVTNLTYLVSKRNFSTAGTQYSIYTRSAIASLTTNIGGTTTNITTSNILDGGWHHVVISFAASGTGSFYVDGVLDGSNIARGASVLDVDVLLGARRDASNTDATGYFDGDLDDVRFYDVELTGTDVTTLYTDGAL